MSGIQQRMMMTLRHRLAVATCSLALLLAGCGQEPAPDYHPRVSEEDRARGAEQHPALLAEFGGAYAGEESAYVTAIGEKVATAAGLPQQCTFTLVNSDVVNAFAVPGCYIYVTRGLMAIVTSEAQLASVLGHEIGHIAGGHSQRQESRSLWRTLGVILVSMTGSERLTQIAGQAAQYFTLRYSRTQEYEADDLGIRYLKAAGYDPYAASQMLGALQRQEDFMVASQGRDEARGIPEWARSHPLTERRIERAHEEAVATGVAENALPEGEAPFLAHVDGLLYGDDPEQGFVIGRRFAHPVMRIGFEAPDGFTLTNSPRAIQLDGPDGIRGEFGGGEIPPEGIDGYAELLIRQLVGDAQAQVGAAQRRTVNGLPAIVVPVAIATRDGSVTLSVAAYDAGGGHAYHFIIASPGGADHDAAIAALFGSFHLLSAQEVAALRPRVIRVVPVKTGDTVASIAARVADAHPAALFRALNGLTADDKPPAGDKVKIVVAAPGG
jgi:predicted Zn-dependent protease